MQEKKIALVGSGPAGVYAAYILSQNPNFKITMFDKSPTIGMDSSSFTINVPKFSMPYIVKPGEKGVEGQEFRIDVPLRSFSDDYYPCLTKLYEHAKIPTIMQPHHFSFSTHDSNSPVPTPFFVYEQFEIFGISLETPILNMPIFAQARLIADFFRFSYACQYYADNNRLADLGTMTIKEFFDKYFYSKEFAELLVIPLITNIATCSFETACNYPANVVMDWHKARSNHKRVACSINDVVKTLTEKVTKIRNKTSVKSVYKDYTRTKQSVVVEFDDQKDFFDEVIICSQANHAANILRNHPANNLFVKVLDYFPYEKTNVVTHMDQRFLPVDKTLWSPIIVSSCVDKRESHASVILNDLCGGANFPPHCPPIIQTSNNKLKPDPRLVLSETSFERAVVKTTNAEAIDALNLIQGHNNIYCIGSYAYPGIPLLEGAVVSAMKVSHKLGYTCPWFYVDPTNRESQHPRESLRGIGQINDSYFTARDSPDTLSRFLHRISDILDFPIFNYIFLYYWYLLWLLFAVLYSIFGWFLLLNKKNKLKKMHQIQQ